MSTNSKAMSLCEALRSSAERVLQSMGVKQGDSGGAVDVSLIRRAGRWHAVVWLSKTAQPSRRRRARVREEVVRALQDERSRSHLRVGVQITVRPEVRVLPGDGRPDLTQGLDVAAQACAELLTELKEVRNGIAALPSLQKSLCRYAVLLVDVIAVIQKPVLRELRGASRSLRSSLSNSLHSTYESINRLYHRVHTIRSQCVAHRFLYLQKEVFLAGDLAAYEEAVTPQAVAEWSMQLSEAQRLIEKVIFDSHTLIGLTWANDTWQRNYALRSEAARGLLPQWKALMHLKAMRLFG